MLKAAAFVAALVVVSAMYVVSHARLRRRIRRNLGERSEIAQWPDADRAEIATFILGKLAEVTGLDLMHALPSDRFADLQIDEFDSMASVEIITEVESRYGITISNEEAKQMQTLGDFVELVVNRVRR
ncbi:MAG TPA: phosphopantetheine-binding protein [Thermoanaerobaculia bacterium]|nr:phosphopantetheine-binding protein [Thermoanaerobaculia bacterium]